MLNFMHTEHYCSHREHPEQAIRSHSNEYRVDMYISTTYHTRVKTHNQSHRRRYDSNQIRMENLQPLLSRCHGYSQMNNAVPLVPFSQTPGFPRRMYEPHAYLLNTQRPSLNSSYYPTVCIIITNTRGTV